MNAYFLYLTIFITGFAIGFLLSLVRSKNQPSSEAREWQKKFFESEKQNAELKAKTELLPEKFENIANKILEANSLKLSKESEKNLINILNPLKEQINTFKQKVETSHKETTIGIGTLKNEVLRLRELNQKISEEADNLTKALKGSTKTQGNWGEMVLDRILQSSGLREGEEYVIQAKDMKLEADEGNRLKPDVIINLPDNKHIVIDSKVSLLHYEGFISADEESMKEKYLTLFINSVKEHIKGLAGKKYQHLEGLSTPDFVLMFMPIEGAFSLAMQNEKDLFSYAWERGIVIVSPTNLIAILRTIESLWKLDKQNKNTYEIAKQGGDLYDKFVGFVEDLENIGRSIAKSNETYEGAMNKLKTGRGNLISRAERIKELGAKTKKELPKALFDESE
jgi:DNA recombination protein RmuC